MRPSLRAFSLLELILVLVLLGITTAVVAVRLSPLRRSSALAQGARTLMDQFNRGQRLAIARGDLARLRLDLDAQTAAVQVRSETGFADPADGEAAACPLRFGAEAQTIAFAGVAPGATPDAAPPQAQTTGRVDILFYPDARCEPSGSVTLRKGASVQTVVFPAAGRPAHAEDLP